MKTYLLPLILFLFSIDLLGQSIVIEGRVESSNGEPLPFATLSIANGTRGTISNSNGQFRLVLKEDDQQDSLRISYVGYQSKIIKLNSVSNSYVNIKLVETLEQLDDVVVTSLTADQILENALNNIPKNYYDRPYVNRGFYRVSSKKNDNYVHLSEAVFDMYRSKVPEEVDQFSMVAWRGITDKREAEGIYAGQSRDGLFTLDEVNSKWFLKTFGR